jgi:tetraacyldisaccharide 4'-kinase
MMEAGARRPRVLVPLLAVLAVLYGGLSALRHAAYRLGWRRVERAGCPVLSVGNLTVGGSGKTPLVDWLLRAALAQGRRPAALSRGYRARSAAHVLRVRADEGGLPDPVAMGDEPALLARRNPAVPVYVARRRTLAARLAAAWDRPELLVLDDGFQHLALARDLDVVLVDAQQGLGNGRLLPLGPLREPLVAARRAHAVLITKANLGDAETLTRTLRAALGPTPPVFRAEYRPHRLLRLDEQAELAPEALRDMPVRLLCGIAQPRGFAATVEALGARVASLEARTDHHDYGAEELERLAVRMTEETGAEDGGARWLTTEKDAVKLRGRLRTPERMWVLEMEVVPEAAAQAFFFDFIARAGLQ